MRVILLFAVVALLRIGSPLSEGQIDELGSWFVFTLLWALFGDALGFIETIRSIKAKGSERLKQKEIRKGEL